MIVIFKFLNSLKGSWIKRLLDKNNKGMWKCFYNDKISKYGDELTFESNITAVDIWLNFTEKSFLLDVFLAWTKIKGNFKTTHKRNYMEQLVFDNRG